MEGKLTNQEIMGKYGIKNIPQIKTWMKWYKNGEVYRFDQPIGKQYSFGHGPESASENKRINNQMNHLKMENEILKKYLEMKRMWTIQMVTKIRKKFTVKAILNVLGIPRSTYLWLKRVEEYKNEHENENQRYHFPFEIP